MPQIDDIKIGTLRKVLSAFDGKLSWGYELHKKTGISLACIYSLLKILKKAGLTKESWDGIIDDKKCFVLTEKGKLVARTLEDIWAKNERCQNSK